MCRRDPHCSFCSEIGIALLVLFGSRAAGSAPAGSDLDLAVQLRRNCRKSKLDLIHALDAAFHPDPVDLVVLTPDTSPLLRYEIFLKGRLLYEETPGLFERGRLHAWKLYLDTAHLRQSELAYLREFSKRMRHVP